MKQKKTKKTTLGALEARHQLRLAAGWDYLGCMDSRIKNFKQCQHIG